MKRKNYTSIKMTLSTLLRSRLLLVAMFVTGLTTTYLVFFDTPPVDYNADVKPILNQKCISCHGGVKKKGDFSLLFREEALSPTASGKPAIVPGDAAKSDMIRRLHLTDPEERMPYNEEPLSPEEISILTRWIDEGAKFGTHWAYEPVRDQKVPERGLFSFFSKQSPHAIDRFVDQQLADLDLSRNPEADKKILLRRVSLDLIGMPAPDSIAQKYLQNPDPTAYETLIDDLLAKEYYGERWTALWLDLARYADTKGYERDYIRSIWRYRDWLIKSFNQDKPYDLFLTEQLAGDLMPDPTDEQFIATAFHRNTMTNDEGGTDNEEFRTAAILDRVNTTWETLMGTSFACVQCHSHPYDPIKHEEYYTFMAYFNNSRDEDTYDDYPLLREFKGKGLARYDSVVNWVKLYGTTELSTYYARLLKTGQQCINSLLADSMINAALADTKFLQLRKSSWARMRSISLTNKSTLLIRYASGIDNGQLSIMLDAPNTNPYLKIKVNKSTGGWNLLEVDLPPGFSGVHDLYLNYENPKLSSKDDNGMRFDWFALTPSFPGKHEKEYSVYHGLFLNTLNQPDASFTPIMLDNPEDMKRNTYVFERGNWLLKTKQVEAGLPGIFMDDKNIKLRNRLGLAQWITAKSNPLTARTMINRLWEQLFGQGLVETLEDLGSQGALPSHPALLDYLSYQFMHTDNWSIKKTLKRMVMSETYRQSSVVQPDAKEKDPLNKFYARAPRVRLSAEQVRDQALALCGALSPKMYGASVMPYQPEGIWSSPYDERKWKISAGEDQYRRAIYTYLKRTGPYPSMINFDGSAREVCLTRRIRTNTPLQALTLLNDSAYWDISVQLAKTMMDDKKHPIEEVISNSYEKATGRSINTEKKQFLLGLYQASVEKLGTDSARIKIMLSDTLYKKGQKELAAMAVVTNAILNLDEVITKN